MEKIDFPAENLELLAVNMAFLSGDVAVLAAFLKCLAVAVTVLGFNSAFLFKNMAVPG